MFSFGQMIFGFIFFIVFVIIVYFSYKNDKKNNDGRINFILLKRIGKTTLSNQNKISLKHLKSITKTIAQY